MTRYTLAVYNDSPDYIHRFLSYCREHDTFFDVSGFTDPAALHDHVRACGVDLLLLPQMVNPNETLQDTSEMTGKIVYLGEQQDLESTEKTINMYQPMSAILEDLKLIASSLSPIRSDISSDVDILGIYVLDGSVSAGDLVTLLSNSPEHKGEHILYIDLDRFSGFTYQHGISSNGSLSDLIYYFLSGAGVTSAALKNHCSQIGNIHYLAPPVNGGDPDDVPSGQWKAFINTMAEAGNYSTVITNLGSYCRNMLHMFSSCRKIYLFTDSYQTASAGEPSAGKNNFRAMAFHDYFTLNERPDILLKLENGALKAASLTEASRKTQGRSETFRSRWKKAN